MDSIHWKDLSDEDLARFEATTTPWEQALAIDDTWSHLRWRAGERDRVAGQYTTARTHFIAALDDNPPSCLDRAPRRHTKVVQEAAAAVDAGYLDLWPVFEEAAKIPGLPGDAFFLDSIHLRPAGHALIARALADALVAEGRVPVE